MNPKALPVRQIAYFCDDVRAAALAHRRTFGSGPYFVADHVPLRRSEHRGLTQPFDHSSAYGQWGDVMIEFVAQHNLHPSAFHDLFPRGSGRWGLHHVALFVDNVDAQIEQFAAAGIPLAQRSEMLDGFVFAFIDACASFGHMIELYSPVPALVDFYAMVAQAALGEHDGDNLTTISFT